MKGNMKLIVQIKYLVVGNEMILGMAMTPTYLIVEELEKKLEKNKKHWMMN